MIERRREGQRGILTNWKAVKAKARRRRSLELKERGKDFYTLDERGEKEREKERISRKKTSRATLVSRWAS